MSDLTAHIKATIRQSGPMSVAAFMQQAVSHYYAQQKPFGRDGDFITAPEISQMFGEMIGLWVADVWEKLGRPDPFTVLECGPGRGTLMVDMLRAAARAEGGLSAVRVVLMENSPALRAVQGAALAGYAACDVAWIEDLAVLKAEGPLIAVGNEFLDALPIHQAQYQAGQWHERMVGLDHDGALTFGLGAVLPTVTMTGDEGAIFEFSPAREAFMVQLVTLLKKQGGAGLFIDYGHTQSGTGDTLQAMKDHKFVDVFDGVGTADLTSHVDFAALKNRAEALGLFCPPVVEQGRFLEALGLIHRAQSLMKGADELQQKEIKAAYDRLCAPDQMGVLFKVMGMVSDPSLALAGFQE